MKKPGRNKTGLGLLNGTGRFRGNYFYIAPFVSLRMDVSSITNRS
jgi:hypothetical protein